MFVVAGNGERTGVVSIWNVRGPMRKVAYAAVVIRDRRQKARYDAAPPELRQHLAWK